MQASLLTYTDVEGSDARLARLLGLHLGILDETPQQRELEKDERGVFYRDDMPVSKNQRIPIPRRNRVYGDESVMWLGSRSGRLLPRHLARLEESTRAYGFRPEAADAGSPTLAAIRPEDFGSVAQWRARTLDTLLSQKDIDVDSVMDALRSVRGKGFAVEGLYRAFQAHTGRELDSVLADVLGGEDAAYAAQLYECSRIPLTPVTPSRRLPRCRRDSTTRRTSGGMCSSTRLRFMGTCPQVWGRPILWCGSSPSRPRCA